MRAIIERRIRFEQRDGDDDDREGGDGAEDQRAATKPFDQRRQRKLGPRVRDERRVASQTPLPVRFDARAALRAEDEAYFFEFFTIGQCYLTSRQDRIRTPACPMPLL